MSKNNVKFYQDNYYNEKWHTKRWYQENFGVNPEKLDLQYKELENPYYRNAAYMCLWKEEDVEPYKNEKGIEQFQIRSESGKRAAVTRKNNLKNWFAECKKQNPKVGEILDRLWQIHNHINKLHNLKEGCRSSRDGNDSFDFWEYEIDHCKKCEYHSTKQNKLRKEREKLFKELETTCNKSKRTIQLARKYLREEKTQDFSEIKGEQEAVA